MKTLNSSTRAALRCCLLMVVWTMCHFPAFAEGTKQLAPTAEDAPVMLQADHDNFGNFAAYNGPEQSRLYITVDDASEVINLGLSMEYSDGGVPLSTANFGQYRFRIRRVNPNGVDPIVHGPFNVSVLNANITNYAQAEYKQYAQTETQNGQTIYLFEPAQAGLYYIEFADGLDDDGTDHINIGLWDITVSNNGEAIDGRVWSRNWAFRTPPEDVITQPECRWNREFNGTLYTYTVFGFVSKIDFADAGLQGLSFNVAFNRTGPGDSGDLNLDRMSVPGQNATDNTAEHQIFLNEPDPLVFEDGECGTITPSTTFSCLGEDGYCIDVSVSRPGQVELVIDFNQNGIFDPDSLDVSIVYEFLPDELSACIVWNGLRADSTPVDFGDSVDLLFFYSQGVQHWSAYDVEFLKDGFCVETIRPTSCASSISSNVLYWDDRDIPEEPGTGQPKDGRDGCICGDNCRTWDNFNVNAANCSVVQDTLTSGYGDKSTLNTWWFANTLTVVRANIPVSSCLIEGPDTICANLTATFTAQVAGTSTPATYIWTGPNDFSADTPTIENLTVPGEYCLTVIDEENCQTTCCKTLFVSDGNLPDIEYPNLIDACFGDVITVAPSGDITGLTFAWTPTTGLTDPTSATQTITVTQPIIYSVVITSSDGVCTKVETIQIDASAVPTAALTSMLDCDGLTVNFTNQSTDATNYLWDFGDTTTDTDTSSATDPSYTYPALGMYTVTLIAFNSGICGDTLTQDITINTIDLAADFALAYAECSPDSVVVELKDNSVGDGILSHVYTIDPLGVTLATPDATFTVYEAQTITITYTITNGDGCSNTVTESFDIQLGAPDDQFPDELLVCPGDSIMIAPGGDPDFVYAWTPMTGLSDPASPAPVFFPTETTVYTVMVSSYGADTCTVTEMVTVTVPPSIGLTVLGDGTTCEPTATLAATTDLPADIVWTNMAGDTISTETTVTVDVSGTTTYTATATDSNGCTESVTATVAGGPVNVVFQDTVAICLGEEEVILMVDNLDPNDTLTYSWTPTDLFAAGTAADPLPDYLEAVGEETVSVTVTNQFGCSDAGDIIVAVIDPNALLGFTSEVQCDGATVAFTNTSTDAFGYLWLFGDGATSTEENPTYTYAEAGTYPVTLTLVYDVDCVENFTMNVTVEDPQIIADFTYEITGCSADGGATIDFFDASTNTFNNTTGYDWVFENANPTLSSEQNPTVTGATSPLVVTFTIFTANNCEATVTRTIEFTLTDIELTDSLLVCPGDSGILNPDGDPDFNYVWSPATGLNDPTAASPVVTPLATTTYYVTVTSSDDPPCITVDSIVVFVPEEFDPMLPDTVLACSGEATLLNPGGNTDLTYVWSPATNLDDATSANPIFTATGPDEITYTVMVSDEFGCTVAETLTVTVSPDLMLTASPLDTNLCNTAPLQLTAASPVDGVTFTWYAGDFANPIGTGSPITVTPEEGVNNYFVIGTDALGCADTLLATATVQVIDTGLPPDSLLACYNEQTPLNPDGNPAYTYEWSPDADLDLTTNGAHNPIATLTEATTYFVTITDPAFMCTLLDTLYVDVSPDLMLAASPLDTNLCSIEPLELTANSPVGDVTLEWYNTDYTMLIDTGSPITVTPMQGTNIYHVVATDVFGCSDTLTATANVQVFDNGLPPDTVFVCENVATPLNPDGNPAYDYVWSPTDNLDLVTIGAHNPLVTVAEPAVYFVTVTDPAFMCTVLDTVYVEVYDQPSGEILTQDTVLCESGDIQLVVDTDAPTIEWYDNPDGAGTPVATGSPATITPPAGTTVYYLYLTSADGCTELIGDVQVDNYPLDVMITPPMIICDPIDFVTLEITNGADDQDLEIVWEPLGVDPTTGPVVMADPNVTNTFTATVTNQFGCSTTLSTTVDVVDFTMLEISAEPDTILLGNSTVITVTGCDTCTFTWFPPNGTIDPEDGPVITATPSEPGLQTYEVEVELLGCIEILTIEILVIDAICDADHVFLPNAFTPNGDGSNDVLQLRSEFLEEFLEMELMIYDRWGEQLFRTTDPFEGWDGTFRGERLPPDVYGFYLRVVCPDDQELIQQGNITILR